MVNKINAEKHIKNKAEEAHLQLEWGRLQHEAIAAQRWRLEQEMEQSRQDKMATDSSNDAGFMGIDWRGQWLRQWLRGGLVLSGFGAMAAYTWW